MVTIFRVTAGVIIGFLLIQIYYKLTYEDSIQNDDAALRAAADLDTGSQWVKNSIADHYETQGFLPAFVSDLNCDNEEACKVRKHTKTYYLKKRGNWIAFTPYLQNEEIKYSCAVTISKKLNLHFTKLGTCGRLDVSAIPVFPKPGFDCEQADKLIEKLICASDRLIDSDIKLNNAYRQLQERMSAAKKRQLRQEQNGFIRHRAGVCSDIACIDRVTRQRIAELQAY